MYTKAGLVFLFQPIFIRCRPNHSNYIMKKRLWKAFFPLIHRIAIFIINHLFSLYPPQRKKRQSPFQNVDKVKILMALPSNTHKGFGQHFATQSCPLDRWHFFAIATLTLRKPHKHAVSIKVFGLAFFKKQAGGHHFCYAKAGSAVCPILGSERAAPKVCVQSERGNALFLHFDYIISFFTIWQVYAFTRYGSLSSIK